MDATIQIPNVLKHGGLDAALRGLQALAERDLLDLGAPPLYRSGVRYKKEPRGRERWLTPSVVMLKGTGDCEDLAAWRAAELRVSGEDPGARAIVVRSGPRRWHSVVERTDSNVYDEFDEFEDPSAALGMTIPGGMTAPVRFVLERKPGGRVYQARLSMQGGSIYGVSEYEHECPAEALLGAVCEAQDSYMGQIPFLQPFLQMLAPAAAMATTPPKLKRPPAPGMMPPGFGGGSLEDGVLNLAMQLRRIAKREAARSIRRR